MPYETLAVAALIVFGAYLVFGLVGFGSTVLALPLLAFVMPLKFAVPLLLLLDLAAGLLLIPRMQGGVRLDELGWLVPSVLAGLIAGLTLFIRLPEEPLLLLLALFLIAYASYGLLRRAGSLSFSRLWSVPFGLSSGVFTAMFGTGGVLIALYISGRIESKNELRATAASFIFFSAAVRAMLFGATGFLTQENLLLSTLILLPAMLGGLYAGHRLHSRVSTVTVVRAVYAVLAAAGISLLGRVFAA